MFIAGFTLSQELITVIEVFNRGISNPDSYDESTFKYLWKGNERELNGLGMVQMESLGEDRAGKYKNELSTTSLWDDDAEDENIRIRAIGDDSC